MQILISILTQAVAFRYPGKGSLIIVRKPNLGVLGEEYARQMDLSLHKAINILLGLGKGTSATLCLWPIRHGHGRGSGARPGWWWCHEAGAAQANTD